MEKRGAQQDHRSNHNTAFRFARRERGAALGESYPDDEIVMDGNGRLATADAKARRDATLALVAPLRERWSVRSEDFISTKRLVE